MNKTHKIISTIIKLAVTVCALVGVILCAKMSANSFMGGVTTMLYFTIQSNIWIAAVCLVCAVIYIIELITSKTIFPQWLYIVKQVFTVSITLTGVVFCAMIAPFFGEGAWEATNVLTHLVVPVLAVVDFLVFDYKGNYTYKKMLFCTLPPIYYLFFSLIGYFQHWDFGMGNNYPYAFLNYGGSAGVFGFSTDLSDSLFLGSFYWILLLVVFVLGVGALYTYIARKNALKHS